MGGRVLIADHVSGDISREQAILSPLDVEIVLASASDESTLKRLAEGADAIAVCYAKVTQNVIEAAAASGCRVIARYGIGVDNVDVSAATALGIPVTNVPDYCIEEVADHTMAL